MSDSTDTITCDDFEIEFAEWDKLSDEVWCVTEAIVWDEIPTFHSRVVF